MTATPGMLLISAVHVLPLSVSVLWLVLVLYLLGLRLGALNSHLLQQQLCPLLFSLNLLHLYFKVVP